MKNIKIFRLDVFFWILLLVSGICWYLFENKTRWAIIFLIIAGFYLNLTFWIRAVWLQSKKENQRITQLSDINNQQVDTSGWFPARGVIINFNPLGKVMDNGKKAGRLFSFMVQIEGDDNSRWRTLIKDIVIPESHLKSFGKYTELMVLYNSENKYEAVIESDDWHHEVKE